MVFWSDGQPNRKCSNKNYFLLVGGGGGGGLTEAEGGFCIPFCNPSCAVPFIVDLVDPSFIGLFST